MHRMTVKQLNKSNLFMSDFHVLIWDITLSFHSA